jgi:hypothetical protein
MNWKHRLLITVFFVALIALLAIFSAMADSEEVCLSPVDVSRPGMAIDDPEALRLTGVVQAGASLRAISPVVILAPGFRVEQGGQFEVINQHPCPGCDGPPVYIDPLVLLQYMCCPEWHEDDLFQASDNSFVFDDEPAKDDSITSRMDELSAILEYESMKRQNKDLQE